ERSLDADMGLAFARDSQSVLREDLRVLVMSATLDGERVSGLLEGAEVLHSEGRAFPVTTHYVGRNQAIRLEEDVAKTVHRLSVKLKAEAPETMLVFLPGQGEIHRVASML